jgi:thiamine-phosphate pyrophosphorylase
LAPTPTWLSPLVAIVDADVARRASYDPVSLGEQFLAAGARLLQIRAKHVSGWELLEWTDALVARAAAAGGSLVVNDRADIALAARASGVHVGQDDLPVEAVRHVLGPSAIVGLSTHTRAQVDEAASRHVSYVAVGPVFDTRTKERPDPTVGLDLVRYAARQLSPTPVVAIGGITLERATEVMDAGASAVAVITDLLSTNPGDRVRAFLARLTARD